MQVPVHHCGEDQSHTRFDDLAGIKAEQVSHDLRNQLAVPFLSDGLA